MSELSESPIFIPSAYQENFFTWVADGTGSCVLVAVAGSGKTTSVIKCLKFIKTGLSVRLLAFNTTIADELKQRLVEEGLDQRYFSASTFHSMCFNAVRKFLEGKRISVGRTNGNKMRELAREHLMKISEAEYDAYADFSAKLVGLAKGEGIGALVPDVEERWFDLVKHHDLQLDTVDADEETGIAHARALLKISNERALLKGELDFDDQLYLVCLWKLRLWQNDWLFVDECFVPDTPILIGLNGEQKTIKELYDEQYTGSIVTWSREKGTHLSQIIGAKRVVVGKPMVRIRTQQIGYAKNGTRLRRSTEALRFRTRTLVCTEDHKIWTVDGWVTSKDLHVGAIVKHETIAPVVRTYQSHYAHTADGRSSLAKNASIERFGNNKYIPEKFPNRGGNGRGPSNHEKILLDRLGEDWVIGKIVPTGAKRINYNKGTLTGRRGESLGTTFTLTVPTHYKLDLSNENRMVTIEVDGKSHNIPGRKEQDIAKTTWLQEHGWTVVRVTNKEVRSLNDEELSRRIGSCPVDAEVISVEPWTNKIHTHVYDLSVKDTNCYFAHGLLVHNCQDTNPVRRAVAKLALKPGGRLVAVGDARQSIYGFTGASNDAIELIKQQFNATELPLTVSYRCAKAIVTKAQEIVPYIEAFENAPEGVVETLKLEDALPYLDATSAVLCRQTAPLIELAYSLIAKRIGCRVLGREIGAGLVSLIKKCRARGIDQLLVKLETFREREVAKFTAKGEEMKAEAVNDKIECVLTVINHLAETQRTIPALIAAIEGMFSDQSGSLLTLSTVHKSKGKEWSTVAILRPELSPSRWARQDWQMVQEENLMYVSYTRAKTRLIFLLTPPKSQVGIDAL